MSDIDDIDPNTLFRKTIEQLISRYPERLNFVMNDSLDELSLRLHDPNKPISLVVGTGVTASVGMPVWNKLLGRLEVNTLDFEKLGAELAPDARFRDYQTIDRFKDATGYFDDPDPLVLAEYIKLGLPNPHDPYGIENYALMKTLVRKALEVSDEYVKSCLTKNTYLSETVRLINAWFLSESRRVITFNYDNLLEWYYEMIFHKPAFPVFDSAEPKRNELNIYHIHGFLGLKGTNLAGKESRSIILTEDDYRELERYPYCWENYLLTRVLHEGDSLFLGFSGVDFNFKRILRGLSMTTKHNRRYLVVDLDGAVRLIAQKTAEQRAGATTDEMVNSIISILFRRLEIQERYWEEKAFTPIWTTRDNCPKLMQLLMKNCK